MRTTEPNQYWAYYRETQKQYEESFKKQPNVPSSNVAVGKTQKVNFKQMRTYGREVRHSNLYF